MAIAIAVVVGLGAAAIDGELNLEVGFRIAQVDQCEVVKHEAISSVETERPSVEIDRAGLVENADHDVDRFRHRLRLPCCQESAGNPHITLWPLPLTAFGPARFDEGEVTLLRALWSTQKQQNFRSTLDHGLNGHPPPFFEWNECIKPRG